MDGYLLASTVYDAVLEPMIAPLREVARAQCPPQPGWVVLDVGCGTGSALVAYERAGCIVIGTDPSPAMLARARGRLGAAADLRRITGPTLPVDDGCADLALICLVLHSVPRPEAVALLREARRALAPGGRIQVIDFGAAGLRFPRGHLTRGLATVAELSAGPRHARNSLAYLRAGGLPSLVAEAGLTICAQRPTAGGSITVALLAPPAQAAGSGACLPHTR